MLYVSTMVDIPKRLTQKGGVSLPNWDLIHVYKAPPQSVFTRKFEPVSEADVNYMIRPDGPSSDPTRINENIQYFSRGVNPSVEVNYQNFNAGGSKTNTLHSANPGAIYKLDVVRPPLMPVETLLPLSRPRTHQNKTVNTTRGLPGNVASNSLADDVDKEEVRAAIIEEPTGPQTVQATAYYKLEAPNIMSARYAINDEDSNIYDVMTNPSMPVVNTDDFVCREQTPYGVIVRPTYSVTANPSKQEYEDRNDDASNYARKEILLQNIRPNFQIVIYDPATHSSSEVSASIAEKNNIAVQASVGRPIMLTRQDGTHIKLKDYNWTAVNTNVGYDHLILTIEDPELQLERNVPLYASQPSIYMPTDMTELQNPDFQFDTKVMSDGDTNVGTNMNIHRLQHRKYDLESNMNSDGYTNPGLNKNINRLDHIDYDFEGKLQTEGYTNKGLRTNINKLDHKDYQFETKLQTEGYTNPGTFTDVINRKNQDYELEGKIASQKSTNLRTLGYNSENSRKFQGLQQFQKDTYHTDFNMPANNIPSSYRATPQYRLKDNTQDTYVQRATYERLFE